MFNTNTNIVNINNETNEINYNIPEDIKLNVHKQDDNSFFIEVDRNSQQYRKLLCKEPVFIEKEYHKYKEWEINCNENYHMRRIKELEGGCYQDKETPCTVLNIQYIGKDKFLFEIKLIK